MKALNQEKNKISVLWVSQTLCFSAPRQNEPFVAPGLVIISAVCAFLVGCLVQSLKEFAAQRDSDQRQFLYFMLDYCSFICLYKYLSIWYFLSHF